MDRFAATAEIFDMLEDICHVHGLSLALTWVCYSNESDLNLNRKRILCIEDTACYVKDLDKQGFVNVCARSHLEEGQGVAGKALQLIKYFVPDVTALDVVDYPFGGNARKFGLRAAVAIGLKSKCTNCDYYVLEFFLPRYMIEELQLMHLIDELSLSLQKRSKDWRTVSLLESNEANRSENGFEEVHRRPLPPSSQGGLNLNEMMNPRNGEVETCEPFEQEVREKNHTVELAEDDVIPVVNPCATKQIKCSSKRRKTSVVWESFDKVEENGQVWAICKVCERRYPGESKKGTSNLHKHSKKCSREKQRDAKLGGSTSIVVERNFLFDQERSRLDMARMIIKHPYAMDIIEHEFFEIFVKNLQPMFKIYSQDDIKADVLDIYRDEKEKLCKYFDNLSCHFCFRIRLQPYDDKRIMYCCLMLHFIDDEWELKEKVIAFKNLGYNYDVGTLYEVIEGVWIEWNFNKNMHFVLAEIAPPNDQMVGKLKSMLTSQVSVLGKDLFFVSCYAQFLNLLVQDGVHEIKNVLHKIRESIEYVTGTPINRCKFQEAINQVKLQDKKMFSRDVPTRWDTTFLMLESALELRKAFAYLEQVDHDFVVNLSMEESNQATVICECLKVFHDSICTSSTSIDVYFENLCSIYKKLLQWEKSEHAYVRSMTERMKIKFDRYWSECSFPLGIIAVLDPRFKFDLVDYAYQQIFGADARRQLSRFHDDLTCVYNKYASSISNVSYNPNFGDKVCTFSEWRKHKYDSNTVHSNKKELDQYLEQPPENLNDVLAWWRSNTPKFPVLGRMARDFLAIPKSTYAFKSSSISEVMKMNPAFSDLGPEIIEALICGQDWLETPRRK